MTRLMIFLCLLLALPWEVWDNTIMITPPLRHILEGAPKPKVYIDK